MTNDVNTRSRPTIRVVGGGIAGLVAAIECAERGARVELYEARTRLGGRGATNPGPYRTGLGPHAFYEGGSLWSWLAARSLHDPYKRPQLTGIRYHLEGRLRAVPPGMLTVARRTRRPAPIDRSYRDWMTEQVGPELAELASTAAGVLTFDHDPGRLSARFVAARARRILFGFPPAARYVVGGWSAVIDRMHRHANDLGITVHTGAKVDHLDPAEIERTILAVSPRAARTLLDDDTLRVESPHVALVDIGLRPRRRDPYLVVDLDGAAFVDRFTAVDDTLAPDGQELVQASVGIRPDETPDQAADRIEAILDIAYPNWRERTVMHRRSHVHESTGAIDLPGTDHHHRPAIEHPSGALLTGDWVAAPGHLAEVSCTSAVVAARTVLARTSPAMTA